MNYLEDFKLFSLIETQNENENIFQLAINEYNNILESYDMNDYFIIQESLKEEIKSKFKKLIERIKELWSKFIDRMTNIFSKKIDWLSKHENEIRKPVKIDLIYDMYPYFPYGDKMINKIKIPQFNFEKMKEEGSLESDEAFLNKYFPELIVKDTHYSQVALLLFKGGKDKEVKRINFKDNDMYSYFDYCKGIEKRINNLKREKNGLVNDLNKISTMIDRIAREKKEEIKNESTDICKSMNSVLYENTIYNFEQPLGEMYLTDTERDIFDTFKVQFNINFNNKNSISIHEYYDILERIEFNDLVLTIFNHDFYLLSRNLTFCMANYYLYRLLSFDNKFIIEIKKLHNHLLYHNNSTLNRIIKELERLNFKSCDNNTRYLDKRLLIEKTEELDNDYNKLNEKEKEVFNKIEKTYKSRNISKLSELTLIIDNINKGLILDIPITILNVTLTITFIGAISILNLIYIILSKVSNTLSLIKVISIEEIIKSISKLSSVAKNIKMKRKIDNLVSKYSLLINKNKINENDNIINEKVFDKSSAQNVNYEEVKDEKEKNGTAKPTEVKSEKNKNEINNKKINNEKEKLIKSVSGTEDTKLVYRFQQICSNILTAKMTTLDEANSFYLKILEKHVKSYIGNKDLPTNDNTESKPKKINSNFTGFTKSTINSKSNSGKTIVKYIVKEYKDGKEINKTELNNEEDINKVVKGEYNSNKKKGLFKFFKRKKE